MDIGRVCGTEADLQVDGCPRNARSFRKMAAYITQKDHLLLHLSVVEYLGFAAHLKLGDAASSADKSATVISFECWAWAPLI